MSGGREWQEATYVPPTIGTVYVVTATTAATVAVAIDPTWRGSFITLQGETADVYYALGVITTVISSASAGSPAAQGCARLSTGSTRSHFIPFDPAITHLLVRGTTGGATDGVVRIWKSSPNG